MNCIFESTEYGCHCVKCGRKVKRHNGQNLLAKCKEICKHLGSCTHETINVICKDCKGNNTSRSYSLHSCSIHTLCIPNFRCTDASKQAIEEWQEISGKQVQVMPCLGCDQFYPETVQLTTL